MASASRTSSENAWHDLALLGNAGQDLVKIDDEKSG